jgi:ribosomal protein L11 methyltransferase
LKWLEVRARVGPGEADDVAALLGRFGRGGVVVEEGPQGLMVKAYLPVDRALPKKKERLYTLLGHLSLIVPLKLEEEVLEEADWALAWRAHFTPLHIGRLVIKPSWHDCAPGPGETVLELDPGQAFGTGHHPTTRMCLLLLEKHLRPGMEVLDLGTGSGILALAAARLGAASVLALDTDPLAVKAARENVRKNGLTGTIKVRKGTLAPRWGSFDLIVANLTARPILELLPALSSSLKTGGVLIAGGIIGDREDEVEKGLLGAGLKLQEKAAEGEWRTLAAHK